MSWYLIKLAQGLDNYLRGLGATEDIIEWLVNMPDKKQAQFYVNELRKNPTLNFEQIQQFQAPQKIDPYMDHEKDMADNFPEEAIQWILTNLKQARNSRLDTKPIVLLNPGGANDLGIPQYRAFWTKLDYWNRTNGLTDWLEASPNININDYDVDQVDEMIGDWHEMMAGKGEGKMYMPTDKKLIHYGPKWQNEEFNGWTIQEVRGENDLLAEGNKMNHCFAAGTLIRSRNGYRPIEEIKVNEEVLCGDGTFRKVNKTFKHYYEGDMVKFRTRFGISEILVTPDHKIMSLIPLHRGQKPCSKTSCGNLHRVKNIDANHDINWVEAKNLSCDHYLCSQVPTDFVDLEYVNVSPEHYGKGTRRRGDKRFKVDSDFLWVVGMYIAEGSSTENHVQFSLSLKEKDFANRIISFFQKHGFNPRIRKDLQNYGGLVVVISSRMLAIWLREWVGHGCDKKIIPSELFNLPNEKIKYLIQGISDGDGHDKTNTLHQTSLHLALQVVEIGLRMRCCPTNSLRDNSPRNRKTSCTTENANPNVLREDLLKNTKRLASRQKNIWMHKDNILIKPHKWEIIYFSGNVYNLEVDTVHSYVVENILVKNCVGGYCERVDDGEVRVFSLRDPQNNPHVTIETDDPVVIVEQIQGNSNSEPDDIYKAMIKEWVSKNGPDEHRDNWDTGNPIYEISYYDDVIELSNNEIRKMGDPKQEVDEYGFANPVYNDPSELDFDGMVQYLVQFAEKNSNNNNDYGGDITETPELLVDAALRLDANSGQTDKFDELEKALNDYYDKVQDDFMNNWNWEREPMTIKEEDFETPEEYQEEVEIWEADQEKYEQDEIDMYLNTHLPWGFYHDAFKYIAELRKVGKIAPYVHKAASNWYNLIKLADKRSFLLQQGFKPEIVDWAVSINNKYAVWLANMASKGILKPGEDDKKTINTLFNFDKVKRLRDFPEKDINKFKNYGDLIQAIEPFLEQQTKGEEHRIRETEGAIEVLNRPPYRVLRIDTPEASAKLCRDTEWCVKDPKYYEEYAERGPLYLILENDEKIALVHYESNSFMDAYDRPLDHKQKFDLIGLLSPVTGISIFNNAEVAYEYAEKVMTGKFPAGEKAIASNPKTALHYVFDFFDRRWPPGEAAIAKDPESATAYAREIIKDRWPEGEAAIASNSDTAYLYAMDVIKDRWPEGEPAIASNVTTSFFYVKNVIKGRFPEGEKAIATIPHHALWYAMEVIKDRWPEGEKIIFSEPATFNTYAQFIHNLYGHKTLEQTVELLLPSHKGDVDQALSNINYQYMKNIEQQSFTNWYGILKLANKRSFLLQQGFDPKIVNWAVNLDNKYAVWLANMAKQRQVNPKEDSGKLVEILGQFEKVKRLREFPKEYRDLNKFKSYSELYNAIQPFLEQQTSGEIFREKQMKGVEEVYNEGGVRVVAISTAEAASKLCRDTGWCIKDPKYFDYYQKGEFSEYMEEAYSDGTEEPEPLHMFVINNKPVAMVHRPSLQIKDVSDESVDWESEEGEKIFEVIKELNLVPDDKKGGDFHVFASYFDKLQMLGEYIEYADPSEWNYGDGAGIDGAAVPIFDWAEGELEDEHVVQTMISATIANDGLMAEPMAKWIKEYGIDRENGTIKDPRLYNLYKHDSGGSIKDFVQRNIYEIWTNPFMYKPYRMKIEAQAERQNLEPLDIAYKHFMSYVNSRYISGEGGSKTFIVKEHKAWFDQMFSKYTLFGEGKPAGDMPGEMPTPYKEEDFILSPEVQEQLQEEEQVA